MQLPLPAGDARLDLAGCAIGAADGALEQNFGLTLRLLAIEIGFGRHGRCDQTGILARGEQARNFSPQRFRGCGGIGRNREIVIPQDLALRAQVARVVILRVPILQVVVLRIAIVQIVVLRTALPKLWQRPIHSSFS